MTRLERPHANVLRVAGGVLLAVALLAGGRYAVSRSAAAEEARIIPAPASSAKPSKTRQRREVD